MKAPLLACRYYQIGATYAGCGQASGGTGGDPHFKVVHAVFAGRSCALIRCVRVRVQGFLGQKCTKTADLRAAVASCCVQCADCGLVRPRACADDINPETVNASMFWNWYSDSDIQINLLFDVNPGVNTPCLAWPVLTCGVACCPCRGQARLQYVPQLPLCALSHVPPCNWQFRARSCSSALTPRLPSRPCPTTSSLSCRSTRFGSSCAVLRKTHARACVAQ